MKNKTLPLKTHGYQIDQSNKIEQTERDTVIALSNTIQFAILIKAGAKRKIQTRFRLLGRPRNFIYFTFAALVSLLLQRAEAEGKILIDQEYLGHEGVIYDRIYFYLDRLKVNKNISVEFGIIGKSSSAHILGASVATKKQKPNLIISAEEVLRIIFGKEKDRASRKGPRIA